MSLLRNMFALAGGEVAIPFRVEFADGTHYQNRNETPEFTLKFRTARAEWRTLIFNHIGLLDSFFDQEIDLEGDMGAALRMAMQSSFEKKGAGNPLVRLRNWWHEFTRSNKTLAQARANSFEHYALGTEFYRFWLDVPYMMYTCAYWKDEATRTIEQAQQNKMQHVAKKLRLKPGEHIVDIGSGWGGFLLYAHEHFGTTGVGVNHTTEQVRNGNADFERRGLSDKLKIVDADFREVQGQFDKCVSIGVLEHAGRDQILEVVKAHADSLKPGGLGMLHFIGHVGQFETEFWIRQHIFPGGWIPSLAETIDAMEKCGLEVLDIENLRRNYALTLDAWTERFDANWDKIQALDPKKFTEHFRRKWRMYLVSCAEMFRSPAGYTHLFQILYSKGNVSTQIPMGREYVYE